MPPATKGTAAGLQPYVVKYALDAKGSAPAPVDINHAVGDPRIDYHGGTMTVETACKSPFTVQLLDFYGSVIVTSDEFSNVVTSVVAGWETPNLLVFLRQSLATSVDMVTTITVLGSAAAVPNSPPKASAFTSFVLAHFIWVVILPAVAISCVIIAGAAFV